MAISTSFEAWCKTIRHHASHALIDFIVDRGLITVECEGRVARQVGDLGWFARVRLTVFPAAERHVVLAQSSMNDFYRSEGWLDAAVAGAELGMDLASVTGMCRITSMHGMICDTCPGVVALAAIRAVWTAVSFTPNGLLTAALESCITRSHSLTVDAIRAELFAAAWFAEPHSSPMKSNQIEDAGPG